MPYCDPPVFSCIFSSLKVYPSQCSALRMHTCGATMIHIIATCGNDSNQKLKCNPENNLKRPDSQRRVLHRVQLWNNGEDYSVLLTVLKRNVCISAAVSPLDKTFTAMRRRNALQINKYSK